MRTSKAWASANGRRSLAVPQVLRDVLIQITVILKGGHGYQPECPRAELKFGDAWRKAFCRIGGLRYLGLWTFVRLSTPYPESWAGWRGAGRNKAIGKKIWKIPDAFTFQVLRLNRKIAMQSEWSLIKQMSNDKNKFSTNALAAFFRCVHSCAGVSPCRGRWCWWLTITCN